MSAVLDDVTRPAWRARASAALHTLERRLELRRQRRRLLALTDDPAFLADIGRSRADALREAKKPFSRE